MTPGRTAAPPEMERGHAPRDYLHAGRQARLPRQSAAPWGEPLATPEARYGLTARPESVKAARDFTATMLSRWGMTAVSDQAELVVSELVTNALRHGLRGVFQSCPRETGSPGSRSERPVGLRLLAQPPYLMCMVADPSREIPLRQDVDPDSETGRGLHVIESCSSQWGWHLLDDGGKVVWALLEP